MNTNSLKVIYERLPKGIKRMFSAVFIRLMVYNKEFVQTTKELDAFEKMSPSEQEAKQFQLLKETLTYAYQNVPFYKEQFDSTGFDPEKMKALDDIKRLPLLTKESVISVGG